MKKFLVIIIPVLLATLLVALPVSASDITVVVNEKEVAFDGQNPVITEGRTLVPIRGVFEKLSFEVNWNSSTRQAILTRDDDVIVITIDSSTFITNDITHTLDVSAQIIGGRTLVPLRAVLESVGYSLEWDGSTSTVTVTYGVVENPDYITIRGIRYSTALTELDLSSHDLTDEDIEPLRYMVNLTWLHLRGNQISGLVALSSLTSL